MSTSTCSRDVRHYSSVLIVVPAGWRDVLEVLAVFLGPPSLLWIWWVVRSIRRERRRWREEEEASAAEGYPPPDPPTTDSQVP
jgi:hypothetical protein